MKSSRLQFAVSVFAFCCRIAVSLLISTSYHPDEYFQFQEPTQEVLGLPWISSWEWSLKYRIRSFVPVFMLSSVAGIGFPGFVAPFSRLVHSTLSALADAAMFSVVREQTSDLSSLVVAFFHFSSWFVLYCGSRALSNVIEMDLTILALYLLRFVYQSRFNKANGQCILALSCLAAILTVSVFSRPTALIIVIPIVFQVYYSLRLNKPAFTWFIRVLVLLVILAILFDSWMYGQLTVTPWNFFVVNILQKKAEHFGRMPWHWVLSEGLPVVLGLYFPVFVYGIYDNYISVALPASRFARQCFSVSFLYLAIMNLATSHWEHRFLLPALPGIHVFIGDFAHQKMFTSGTSTSRRWWRAVIGGCAVLHVVGVMYLLRRHQAGPEQAFYLLSNHFSKMPQTRLPPLVAIAAPCFSFPGYAYLSTAHRPVRIRIHDSCYQPPWEVQYPLSSPEDMQQLVQQWVSSDEPVPDYVATFDSYEPALRETLLHRGYSLWANVSHADLRYDMDDPWPKKRVLLYHKESD